jgi:hypothetical protein
MKSVPNLIFYLHEFFWNFSQFLAIYFELFSSGVNFNSENAPRHSNALKALSGPRAGIPTAPFRPRRRRCPNCLAPPRLARPDRAVARSEADHHCPSAPIIAVRPSDAVASFVHGEHRPRSPLTVLCPWSVKLTFPSVLTGAGPPPATVAPPHRRNATTEPALFPSPSTRSFGELFFPPPCPAGSLTVVGPRPPPFAPPPPLWHRRRPCCDTRLGAVTAPACAALRRTVAGRVGRGRPGKRRPRAAHMGRAPRGRGPRTRCAHGPSRRHEHGPSALCI